MHLCVICVSCNSCKCRRANLSVTACWNEGWVCLNVGTRGKDWRWDTHWQMVHLWKGCSFNSYFYLHFSPLFSLLLNVETFFFFQFSKVEYSYSQCVYRQKQRSEVHISVYNVYSKAQQHFLPHHFRAIIIMPVCNILVIWGPHSQVN